MAHSVKAAVALLLSRVFEGGRAVRTGFLGAAALVSMVAAACGPAETEKSIRDALNQADLRRA